VIRLERAPLLGVLVREVMNFRTFWRSSTFSAIVQPIVYLLAFGFGFGSLVDKVGGVKYIEFVGIGTVATAILFSSVFSGIFGTLLKWKYQRTYDALLAAPIDVEELVTAEMLWIGLRAGFYGCFPLVVTFFFGLDPTIEMLLVPIFGFTTALGFAAFGIAVAASVAKIDQFNYVTTLVITPLFLVAGTFFPIDQLPEGLQVLANFNPLYQLVELVRGAAFGFEGVDALRYLALVAFSLTLWRVAVRRMEKRLID
jgi:lipooligosaccharide transport system permease protein